MQRLTAILLIFLILFNAMGFYTVFQTMQYQNTKSLEESFNQNTYDESSEITFRIPLAIPYALSEQADFQRVDGEFERNGEFYRIVKQKMTGEALYIICIRDVENKRIHQALEDYVNTFTDNPLDAKASSKISFNFIKDYCSPAFQISNASLGWEKSVVEKNKAETLSPSYFQEIIQPPEA